MKIRVIVRKVLGLSVATRSRCGFLIALVLIITIGLREAVRNVEVLNCNDAIVCIMVGFIGFFSWLAGRMREFKCAAAEAESSVLGGSPITEDPLGFLRSAKYWGLIFILSASILSLLVICRRPKTVTAHARELPVVKITVTNVVTITNEAPRLVFPNLELQGLVVNGSRSAALINGRVLYLGEEISNAALVAVHFQYAEVAMEGETNILMLRK